MKRVISIILCLTMLFVMAAVPALATDSEGEWVELLNEDFSGYAEGDSFDEERTYENAKAYIYYEGKTPGDVTHSVSAKDGDNALKIAKTKEGDRRILFKLNEARTGQVEISFRMLSTKYISGAMNVEVYNEDNTTRITGTSIGDISGGQRFTTYYNGSNTRTDDITATENYLTADTWVDVKYSINTDNGDVVATYNYDALAEPIVRTIDSTWSKHADSLPAVSGLCIRLKSSSVCDLYVDDIKIKYLEQPAAAESDFVFSEIANGNASEAEVTNDLELVTTYTDSTLAQWNIAWASSNSSVINPQTGAVNPAEVDTEVTLTATFTGSKTFTKTFTLTVPALLSEFDFSVITNGNKSVNTVKSSLNLVTEFTDNNGNVWAVTWNSSKPDVINPENGEVTQGGIDERVTLTAALTYYADGTENETTLSRSFNVKVLAAGSYHINEGFDAEGNYSGENGIKDYYGASLDWGISKNAYGDDSNESLPYMNAHISTDPENSADKVLKLHRIAAASEPAAQRVWTKFNENASNFNDKVYVGMRVLREMNNTPTDIYAYATDNTTRIMRIRFNTDDSLTCYHSSNLSKNNKFENAVPSGEWFDVTIELDMKNGTYNVYIDGQSINKNDALSMSVSGSGFGGLMFDLKEDTTESVIYFDDLTVRTTDGFPYSIVGYNFTDAQGYPTESVVEGGLLKSVTMRKMSAVDSEAEPKLYIGFFKGEKLYDVACAPLSKYALGTFDVTLDKALPANPLDYEVKTFVFSKDLVPLMNPSEYVPFEVNPTIFVAGDSIGRFYKAKEYPYSGYAQELGAFFEEKSVNIENYAEGGRSSKTFYNDGLLDKILENMYSGDYLLIQFGHNDEPEKEEKATDPTGDKNTEGSFKWYLMKYIDGARAKGATPILMTPPSRDTFVGGKMQDDRLIPYVEAMRALANEESVQLVDLYAGWTDFVDDAVEGGIDSKNFYAYFYADDARFADDSAWAASQYKTATGDDYDGYYTYCDATDVSKHVHVDGSHLNIYGARVAAKLIADSLAESGLDLAENIITNRVAEYPWGNYVTFGELVKRD